MEFHEKRRIALRAWIHGARWWEAAEALEFGAAYQVGLRKDRVTPEFSHQIDIAQHVRTLPDILHPDEFLCVALLHDVREDCDVDDSEIRGLFGPVVADAVEIMTKVCRGQRKATADYFRRMAACPIASVVKEADRIHNLNGMAGVFSAAKQAEYVGEGEDLFLPMLKAASRRFPRQETAYQNLRLTLRGQINLVRASLAAFPA